MPRSTARRCGGRSAGRRGSAAAGRNDRDRRGGAERRGLGEEGDGAADAEGARAVAQARGGDVDRGRGARAGRGDRRMARLTPSRRDVDTRLVPVHAEALVALHDPERHVRARAADLRRVRRYSVGEQRRQRAGEVAVRRSCRCRSRRPSPSTGRSGSRRRSRPSRRAWAACRPGARPAARPA